MSKRVYMSHWWIAALVSLLPASVGAACLIDDEPTRAQELLRIHLSASCTQAERETHSVDASTLLAALKQGRSVDLDGVVVRGDLVLEALPVAGKPPPLESIVDAQNKEIRIVAGGLSIVNSVVQGKIVHRSPDGSLVFSGPLTLAGTTF